MKMDVPIISSIFLLALSPFVFGTAPSHIYFTTDYGLKAYSLETSTVTTIVESDATLNGVALDAKNNKLYYAESGGQIYRANTDGSAIEALRSNINLTLSASLALDWRTGNLYQIRYEQYPTPGTNILFVCNTTTSELVCTALPTDRFNRLIAIAVDPVRGEMFITGNDGVYRAQMDGTGFTDIKVGYGSAGIAIVPDSDRVYHVNFIYHQVVSMFRDGSDIVRLGGSGGLPWGVAVVNNSIYWGDSDQETILRSSITGHEVVTVANGTGPNTLLTVDYSAGVNETLSNPCEGRGCSHICVLTGSDSSRCLCPQGWRLENDQMSCAQDV